LRSPEAFFLGSNATEISWWTVSSPDSLEGFEGPLHSEKGKGGEGKGLGWKGIIIIVYYATGAAKIHLSEVAECKIKSQHSN